MSEVDPQGSNNPDNRSIRSAGAVFGGLVLLTIGIILGLASLPTALEDPSTSCAAGHDCIELVDFQAIGWTGVIIALVAAVPGAWMIYWGSQPPDEIALPAVEGVLDTAALAAWAGWGSRGGAPGDSSARPPSSS